MDEDDQYLSDGAYISWNGYGVWIAVNHHENRVACLQPLAVRKLIKYCKSKGMKLDD